MIRLAISAALVLLLVSPVSAQGPAFTSAPAPAVEEATVAEEAAMQEECLAKRGWSMAICGLAYLSVYAATNPERVTAPLDWLLPAADEHEDRLEEQEVRLERVEDTQREILLLLLRIQQQLADRE